MWITIVNHAKMAVEASVFLGKMWITLWTMCKTNEFLQKFVNKIILAGVQLEERFCYNKEH